MTREETLRVLRDALRDVEGLRIALVFGSVARDQAGAQSDLDLAVDASAEVDLAALSAHLGHIVGREVEIVRLKDAGVPLLEALIRDAIPVHEGAPGAVAQWRSHTLSDLEIDRPWYARMRDAWLRHVAERGVSDGPS